MSAESANEDLFPLSLRLYILSVQESRDSLRYDYDTIMTSFHRRIPLVVNPADLKLSQWYEVRHV